VTIEQSGVDASDEWIQAACRRLRGEAVEAGHLASATWNNIDQMRRERRAEGEPAPVLPPVIGRGVGAAAASPIVPFAPTALVAWSPNEHLRDESRRLHRRSRWATRFVAVSVAALLAAAGYLVVRTYHADQSTAVSVELPSR
jgi:negative regulator of sigma E activity